MPELTHALLPERGAIALTGEEAVKFLQGLVSNDVEKVGPTRAIYATLLSPQGRFLFDFFVAARHGGLLIDCEAARAADLARKLTMYKLRSKVAVENLTGHQTIAVAWGEGAAAAFGLTAEAGAATVIDDVTAYIDPRLPALGLRLAGPQEEVARLLVGKGQAVPPEAWHRHRLSLGVPDGSRDVPVDKGFLLEHNFEELNAIDFKKGCYVGQELTARTKYRGLVRKRLFKVAVEGPLPAPGTPVLRGEHEAGVVYSGLDGTALALLRLEDVETGEALTAGDAKLTPVKPDYAAF
ncbi:CAF17-like 4Fe-4S cluster assembly/insertion protein YgfZ [Desertibaculum subflavum]|uniref:CAF17-like 4Fe-4S cluster assembly/insertion protein YgfZ n=1 Tax=Desertibaculum subflavum TaxID=2268458 RepID=UPI000E67262B